MTYASVWFGRACGTRWTLRPGSWWTGSISDCHLSEIITTGTIQSLTSFCQFSSHPLQAFVGIDHIMKSAITFQEICCYRIRTAVTSSPSETAQSSLVNKGDKMHFQRILRCKLSHHGCQGGEQLLLPRQLLHGDCPFLHREFSSRSSCLPQRYSSLQACCDCPVVHGCETHTEMAQQNLVLCESWWERNRIWPGLDFRISHDSTPGARLSAISSIVQHCQRLAELGE